MALCVDRTRDYAGGISLYTEGILQQFLHKERVTVIKVLVLNGFEISLPCTLFHQRDSRL